MSPFPIGGHNMSTILPGKLTGCLARYGGLTLDRVPRIKPYVTHLLSKEAYNPAAIEGTADQLDHDLTSARVPQDPAAPAAWHQNNGLAFPDNPQTESSPTLQGTGSAITAPPAEPTGAPQVDPQALPALYTDVPIRDVEDILNWEPDPSPDHC
jgi:hypothetical protein